jgi:hypothetical protein
MTKKILLALAVLPLAAFAQGAGPGPKGGAGAGPRAGTGPGAQWNAELAQKRMRLARTLGLAEALDLDSAQALKLGDQLSKLDAKRFALFQQMRDSHQVLRRAAKGEKVAPAEVDQAILKALEARSQMVTLEREVVATVTKDLTPEKKARAVLFLARFSNRFGPGPGMKMGGRKGRMMGGNGMGGGMGMGMGAGMGMAGPGPMAGDCPNPDCPWNDEDEG